MAEFSKVIHLPSSIALKTALASIFLHYEHEQGDQAREKTLDAARVTKEESRAVGCDRI